MKRPHIIILNPDEMRADALGHLGNRVKVTPNLDAFAENEAVSFSNAYCQNPVCVPSRCSFFTGLYPHVNGHRTMAHLLQAHESSLFSELKKAGYYVWMNGRNDLFAGQINGIEEKHADEVFYYDKTKQVTLVSAEMVHKNGARKKNDFPYMHYTGVSDGLAAGDLEDTRAACDRILHPVDKEKPLCLFLGWNNPHPPYSAPKEYRDRIDLDLIPDRIRLNETSGKHRMMHEIYEHSGCKTFPEGLYQEMRAFYMAQCALVDDMFRMVCDALKEAGIYDDSAIFFLSDHGDYMGDYDLPEKAQNLFEQDLIHVPLLIKPPKGMAVDPGISDSLTELVDFYATTMDYAGVKPDHTHFGKSLRRVIEDRGETIRSYIFCEGGRNPGETHCDEWHIYGENGPSLGNEYYARMTAQYDDETHEKGTMIFDGRVKYISRLSGKDEFYDLLLDPGERHNAIETASSDVLRDLQLQIMKWYQQTCDIVPLQTDDRFTPERKWAIVRNYCPAGQEERYKEAIKGLNVIEAIPVCLKMQAMDKK